MSCNSLRTDRHRSRVVKAAPDKTGRLYTDHWTAVVRLKVERAFAVVSTVCRTRHQSHYDFIGHQSLKEVIDAEPVLSRGDRGCFDLWS